MKSLEGFITVEKADKKLPSGKENEVHEGGRRGYCSTDHVKLTFHDVSYVLYAPLYDIQRFYQC